MNKFICQCGKSYFKDDDYTKWNKWCKCDCGEKAKLEGYLRQSPQTKFIKGMDYGYNEALGVTIRDRKHYKEVIKEKGAIPL